MRISNVILHVVFIIEIVKIFFDISYSFSKAIVVILSFILLIVSFLQDNKYKLWDFKGLNQNGLFFLLFLLVSIALGIIYGYQYEYVFINVAMIIPLFAFLVSTKSVNVDGIYDIVIFYSIISVAFSVLEYYGWNDIWFINKYVTDSVDAYSDNVILGSLFRDEKIKVFGIFPNALQNGLFIIMAFVIIINKLLNEYRWYYLIILVSYLWVIYMTLTRNVYFAFFVAIGAILLINYTNKSKLKIALWSYILVLYAVSVIGLLYYVSSMDISSDDSLLARSYSWKVIINEYFINNLLSYHAYFGYALTQLSGENAPYTLYWAIDNGVLLIFLSSGLIGVILYILWQVAAINKLILLYISGKSIGDHNIKILIVIMIFYVVSGVMNANAINMTFLLPVLFVLSKYTKHNCHV